MFREVLAWGLSCARQLIILAKRQSVGTSPEAKDLLNKQVSNGDSSCAVSFKMYGDMPSGPVDLFTFNFVRRLTTLGEVTSMCSSIFGYL